MDGCGEINFCREKNPLDWKKKKVNGIFIFSLCWHTLTMCAVIQREPLCGTHCLLSPASSSVVVVLRLLFCHMEICYFQRIVSLFQSVSIIAAKLVVIHLFVFFVLYLVIFFVLHFSVYILRPLSFAAPTALSHCVWLDATSIAYKVSERSMQIPVFAKRGEV